MPGNQPVHLSDNHQFNDFFYGVETIDERAFTIIEKKANESIDINTNFVYFLSKGTVAQYNHTPNNQTVNPYRMHYFDLIGVFELFYPSQVLTEYKAITACTLYAMKTDYFIDLTKQSRDFYQRVLINLINRQSFIASHYMKLINSSVIQRLILFISFSIDSRYFDEHESFTILDSHQVMADSLGCNIRSVHRALKSLEKEGYIQIEGGKVTISKIQFQKCETFS